jgi:multiple sugar transport system ATP-binding protein
MSSVSIRQIKKSFAGLTILDSVDMEIEPGEFIVILGPSGCGKSTLLNVIAGLDESDAGHILIGGDDVTGREPSQRGLAMVFQSYALFPAMTVRRNLSFGMQIAGTPKATIEEKVAWVAKLLQIEPLLERKPSQLSGGQRQRVAIGRALVRSSSICLFDEPLSNLDAKLRAETRVELKQLHETLKSTMIYVTHDQIEAMTMADQIVVMRDGRIEQTGSPLTLYDYPANLFVAGFIGSPSMNFLPGTLRRRAGLLQVELADGTQMNAPTRAVGEDGQPVIFGTRPEHLALGDSGGIPSQVVVVEPTGADTFVACRHQGTEVSVVFHERHSFEPGATIHLQPDLGRAHLFDAGSGKRLAA